MANAEILPFQMDLFETLQERVLRMRLERIEHQSNKTKESADKVRKGTYANIGELRKQVLDLQERLDILERHICRGTDAKQSSL